MVGKHDRQGQQEGAGAAKAAPRHGAMPARGPLRVVAIAAGAILLGLAALYLVGAVVFSRLLFLPGTTLNGEDVSLRPAGSVAAAHSEQTVDYALAVSGQGLALSVPATDVGLVADGQAYVGDALAQVNAWAWPVELFSSRSLEVRESTTFDRGRLDSLVGSAVSEANEDATSPVDARVAYDDEAKAYVVQPEQLGTELDAEAVEHAVAGALTDLDPVLRLTDEVLVRPSVLSDDGELNAAVKRINERLGATQTLKVGDEVVLEVGAERIMAWSTVDESLQVTLDADAVRAWAQGELSDQLDSVGIERSYTRPDGKAVSVSGGSYGWVIDGAALAEQLCANLQEGKEASVEVPMRQQAARWSHGGQDWPARYVDIDLSEQHVRFYGDDGALAWESDCVSGNVSEGHDTPTGVYTINDHMQSGNVELRGRIDPKTNEPEYISYVTYWMPFIENAWALHDASWRGSFGGDIYRYNGSHGCVNLPTDAAASLYSMVHVGDVVVVHY